MVAEAEDVHPENGMCFPVGGRSAQAPECVPDAVHRAATRSYSPSRRSTRHSRSGKPGGPARRSPLDRCHPALPSSDEDRAGHCRLRTPPPSGHLPVPDLFTQPLTSAVFASTFTGATLCLRAVHISRPRPSACRMPHLRSERRSRVDPPRLGHRRPDSRPVRARRPHLSELGRELCAPKT